MQLTSTRKSAIRRPRRRRRRATAYSLPGYLDDLELMYYVDAAESTSWSGSGNWKDLTGNGVDFTPEGSPTYDDTEGGGCFLFDGTDDHFHVDASAENTVNWSASNSSRNYSIEIWFKTFSSGTYQYDSGYNQLVTHRYPVTHSNNNDNNSYWWCAAYEHASTATSRTNRTFVRKKWSGSTLATAYIGSGNNAYFTRDAWNHVVHTWDFGSTGSTGGKILYDQSGTIYASTTNMDLSDFDTVDSNAADNGPDGSLCIGGRREQGALVGSAQLKGAIALVRCYNKVLSAAEVQNIYDNEKSRFGL
jgi:hypothetical protein